MTHSRHPTFHLLPDFPMPTHRSHSLSSLTTPPTAQGPLHRPTNPFVSRLLLTVPFRSKLLTSRSGRFSSKPWAYVHETCSYRRLQTSSLFMADFQTPRFSVTPLEKPLPARYLEREEDDEFAEELREELRDEALVLEVEDALTKAARTTAATLTDAKTAVASPGL